jgi:hypothetical protein
MELAACLVSLNRGNLLILLDVVADLLVPLLQGALGDRLGHLRNFDDEVGVGSHMVHQGRQRNAAHGLQGPAQLHDTRGSE